MNNNRSVILIVLILGSLFWLGTGCSFGGMIIIAPMFFDAPGSQEQLLPWLMTGGIIAAPIIALIIVGISWLLYAKKRDQAALIVMIAPVLLACILSFAGGIVGGLLGG